MDEHEHRHRWCLTVVDSRGLARFRHAVCSCGVAAITPAAWEELDPEAFAQWRDPDGTQREFMAAAGL